MQASKEEIKQHVQYLDMLVSKIKECAESCDDNNRSSGTIKNLSPELAKGASKLNKMLRWGYK